MCETSVTNANNVDIYKLLASFADETEVGMYVSDYFTCEILFVNKRMALYLGKPDGLGFLGKCCWSLINPDFTDRCHFCPFDKLMDSNGKPAPPYTWELYVKPMDIWLRVSNQLIDWTDGRLAQKVVFYDITELKKMQEKLSNLAFTDRLLKIKNDLKLEHDIQQAEPKPSLIIFDINAFQNINEMYSRQVGDRLLMAIKNWVFAKKTPYMELYRIGGDEFCITAEEGTEIEAFAESLAKRFSEPWVFEYSSHGARIFCGASIAIIPGEFVRESEPVLNMIARTLRLAKANKRVLIYDEYVDDEYKSTLMFEFSLKRCVRENMLGFYIHYQPIADSLSGCWNGIEALCRWNSPELGLVAPVMFIPEAERLGLICALGLWVLETSVKACRTWGLDLRKDFLLHVNVSPQQFLDDSLDSKIIAILDDYGYPYSKLCVEITEGIQLNFDDQFRGVMARLRKKGILVALDDFGTGYTNFYQLKNVPVDILKIERTFVNDIEKSSYQQYLLKAMCELAHAINLKLIAEGVETESQKNILTEKGADGLQGYFFSKPLPFEEMEEQLHHFDCT